MCNVYGDHFTKLKPNERHSTEGLSFNRFHGYLLLNIDIFKDINMYYLRSKKYSE